MNLSRKTLIYSSIISIIIVTLILVYFSLMLPSLYVSFMQEKNYESAVELQKGYMKTGSYENLKVKNPTGTLTLELPLTGDSFFIVSKFFRISAQVRSPKLQSLLEQLRYYAMHTDEIKNIHEEDINLQTLREELFVNSGLVESLPISFDFELYENLNVMKELSSRFHIESSNLLIYEANVSDGYNYYTSYIAMGITGDSISVTLLAIMTPRMDEIRPVVFQSLPMIIAVALVLVLLSSQVFSRHIIIPIIKLARHAEYMKEAKNLKLEPIAITGQDEISSLGKSLNELYQKIQESYQELEIKNQFLAEENKRQEVFLRASSHQLKTPITAALLLVQGMINEVGKYKDTKEYLPQVKQQLLSMQKIVENILYLNHCSKNLQREAVILTELVDECIETHHIQLEEKALQIEVEGLEASIETDRELFKNIIDNLLSNAIRFSPEGERICICYEDNRLCITNYGTTIAEELLPHIFEPFVTGTSMLELNYPSAAPEIKGHGLGLYVVSYYAKLLHYQIKLYNLNQAVRAELILSA
jgi:signal transduction histidine kinase